VTRVPESVDRRFAPLAAIALGMVVLRAVPGRVDYRTPRIRRALTYVCQRHGEALKAGVEDEPCPVVSDPSLHSVVYVSPAPLKTDKTGFGTEY